MAISNCCFLASSFCLSEVLSEMMSPAFIYERMMCRKRLSLRLLALILLIFLFSCGGGGGDTYPEYPDGGAYHALREKAIEDAQLALQPGKIAFDAPQQMKVNESTIVTARISKNPPVGFTEGLGDSATIEPIQVNSFLKATLEGDNFDIKERSPVKQGLTGSGFAQWQWGITPKKSGLQEINLSVYVRIKIPDEPEEEVFRKTFNKQIKVAVNPSAFWENNWQWIIENADKLGLTAIGVGILSQWKRLKRWLKNQLNKGDS